ncbi:MAG: hypothetical protein Q8P13_03295 [bacterium]|nr:hypothetical protein [bacterium]
MARIISGILVLLILIGAITLGFVLFGNNPKVKIITITKEAKFTPTELKVGNNEVVKIKNEDDQKHTVRNTETNTNIVTDLQPNRTSGEIVFDDNSRNNITLVGEKSVSVAVLVGNAPPAPQVTKKSTEEPKLTTTKKTTGSKKPLPNTGPGNLYLYPLALAFGLGLFAFSRKIFAVQLSRYQVIVASRNLFAHRPETTLINFEDKK